MNNARIEAIARACSSDLEPAFRMAPSIEAGTERTRIISEAMKEAIAPLEKRIYNINKCDKHWDFAAEELEVYRAALEEIAKRVRTRPVIECVKRQKAAREVLRRYPRDGEAAPKIFVFEHDKTGELYFSADKSSRDARWKLVDSFVHLKDAREKYPKANDLRPLGVEEPDDE